jgi:hypothetical protein
MQQSHSCRHGTPTVRHRRAPYVNIDTRHGAFSERQEVPSKWGTTSTSTDFAMLSLTVAPTRLVVGRVWTRCRPDFLYRRSKQLPLPSSERVIALKNGGRCLYSIGLPPPHQGRTKELGLEPRVCRARTRALLPTTSYRGLRHT